jgi:ABC-type transport system involved in multi-copper enzyme maturation permease subunit
MNLAPPRPRTPLIGPLAGWELVRLARRGQGHRGRLMVGYLLLIGFVLTPIFWFSWYDDPVGKFIDPDRIESHAETGRFARRFALVLLEATLLAVAAMTPGYAAIAVADEKERQTLPLLLTTALSDREIVLGKAAARFVFVVVAALGALPVLSITFFLGGVEPRFLLAGFGLIAGTAVLGTAIGVQAACATDDLRSALVRAYGLTAVLIGTGVIPPLILLSPFGVLALLEMANHKYATWAALAGGLGYPLIQFLVALGFFADAVKRLRREDPRHHPPPRPKFVLLPERRVPAKGPDPLWGEPPDVRPPDPELPTSTDDRPRIPDANPLLWKERFVARRARRPNDRSWAVPVLFAALALLLIAIGTWAILARWIDAKPVGEDEGGRAVMTGGVLLAGVYLLPVAVALASAVARERRQNTLESLLSLPFDRRFVLRTKVRAAVERGWWWAPVSVAAAGFSFGADGGWPLGVAAAAFVTAGGGFVVSLGGLLTVKSKSEVQAFRFLVPAVVVVVGAPVGVWNAIQDWQDPFWPLVGLTAGAVALGLAGSVLGWWAGRALDRVI